MSRQRKGSGKQILLKILQRLSTAKNDCEEATKRLRSGLLLHGSTAEESFESASRLSWAEEKDDDDSVRQGIALTRGAVFLADFFDEVFEDERVREISHEKFPELEELDHEAIMWAMWQLVSSVQMHSEYLDVEQGCSEMDVDDYVRDYSEKYDHFLKSEDR